MTDDAGTGPAHASDGNALVRPGVSVRSGEANALADLRAVLELVARGKLKCSATSQRPSEITTLMIRRVLAEGDFYQDEAIASFAWPLLLQSGGLARLEGTWMRTTARGATVLEDPRPEHLAALWERWLTKAPIDELMRSLTLAASVPVVRGFAIGRTIFGSAAEAWLSGQMSDQQAVETMAERFRMLVDAWLSARGSPSVMTTGSINGVDSEQ